MRLLGVSDLHSSTHNLSVLLKREDFDAILVAGDISNGSMEDARNILRILSDSGVPVFFVPGNMDPRPLLEVHELEGCLNVHGDKSFLKGYSIGGIGGAPISPFSTRIEFTEEELWSLLKDLGEVDLLLSHSPPFGTALDRVRSGRNVGSKSVRKYIEEKKPLLCLCGHIHESSGIEVLGKTFVLNPGPLSWGKYALVELEGINVKPHLGTL